MFLKTSFCTFAIKTKKENEWSLLYIAFLENALFWGAHRSDYSIALQEKVCHQDSVNWSVTICVLLLCSQNQPWVVATEAFLLITAGSAKGEEGDLPDLCFESFKPKCSCRIYQASLLVLCRKGWVSTLNSCVSCLFTLIRFQEFEVNLKQLQWFLQGSVGFSWSSDTGCLMLGH